MAKASELLVVIDRDSIDEKITNVPGYVVSSVRLAGQVLMKRARQDPGKALLWTFLAGLFLMLFLRRR